MEDRSPQSGRVRIAVFYLLVTIAAAALGIVGFIESPFVVVARLAIVLGLLGLVLLALIFRLRKRRAQQESRLQRLCFVLTAAGAAGIPICAILHNLVYALFIIWFGENVWERLTPGGDEPVFFVLALVVCPALFFVGALGGIVLHLKAKVTRPPDVS